MKAAITWIASSKAPPVTPSTTPIRTTARDEPAFTWRTASVHPQHFVRASETQRSPRRQSVYPANRRRPAGFWRGTGLPGRRREFAQGDLRTPFANSGRARRTLLTYRIALEAATRLHL